MFTCPICGTARSTLNAALDHCHMDEPTTRTVEQTPEYREGWRNAIEECARVASQWCNDENVAGWSLIVAIRALKDKP